MTQLKTFLSAKIHSKVENNLIDWDKVTMVQNAVAKTLEAFINSLQSDAPDFIDGDSEIDFNDVFRSARYGLKGIDGADPYAVMSVILKSLGDNDIWLEWRETNQHYKIVNGAFSINLIEEGDDLIAHVWRVKGTTIDEAYSDYQVALEMYCKEIAEYNLEAECIASFV